MYTSLDQDEDKRGEDAESLLSYSDLEERGTTKSSRWASLQHTLLLIFTHFLVAGTAVWLWNHSKLDLDSVCASYTQKYSPVMGDVKIKYGEVLYNGSFFRETIYRKDASPEVDAAWDALGIMYRPVLVPESQAEKSGLRPADHAKTKPEYGAGYPANVEGLHHLHCLNLLRRSLVYNYDYYKKLKVGAFVNEEVILKSHITHCLDILRQQLMCTIDTGVLGRVWVRGPNYTEPFVDFNTKHTCKNFEAVRAWAEKNQVPEDVPEDFMAPPTGRVLNGTP